MSTHAGPGGPSDRERLIESHLPLVRAIARRYAGYGETVEDLIQVGSIALIRASDRFDPERGVAFATFAAPAVEGEIRRHVGDQGGSVRIPRELRRMTGELERSRRRLAASLGRAPTVSELAVDLGVEHEDVERALEAQLAREPAPAASEDVVEAVGEVASLQSTDDRLLLAAGAHVLDDRERRIVFLRFHADMTERDIAQEVGISQAQVSRSLTRALAKLRTELEHSPAPTAGDTTKFPVVSGSERAAQAELRPSAGRKRPAAEPAETKIDTVGALEEQARSGQAEDTSPNQDLELPYHVTVKPEGGDGGSSWIASLDELPGSEARGTTPDEAVAKLRAAMEGWLSAAVDEPRVIAPPERSSSRRKKTSSHSGRFLVRMPSTLHEELTRAAEREQVSLNRFVTTQLAAAVASTGAGAAGYAPPTGTDSPPPSSSGKRNFRFLIAANLAIIVLAATAAIALLVLALERGI